MNTNTITVPKAELDFQLLKKLVQAFFVCKKQGQYNGKKENAYTTKRTGCLFVVGLNYRKRIKKFVITKLCLEHNYEINPDSRKFNIYAVLASISSKYVHKHDIYNAISCQRQQKLQGLNEIELLLKTLQNDENIMSSIATQPAYNDERDQDGSFMRAIFWAYRSAVFEDCT
ncbi:13303_t:CDS:2 [Racocetra persica]|uniref:13303_t:CDS:1 n=1 Tax=Racocetra persica TaxID=160502 RepID=A0ACA9L838_9GLOM|nr:13303_t:CDS:2 [Racocetra persica]